MYWVPVGHRDLGRAEYINIHILTLEAYGGQLGTGHPAYGDVLHMLAHQLHPGTVQHADRCPVL